MTGWFPRPYGAGIKREHGEAYPSGTDTVAAPATVSGERNPNMPLASNPGVGKAGERSDPRARRPASHNPGAEPIFNVNTVGVT
jgi:hypothetical protein